MRTRLERNAPVDYQVERSNAAWADHRARALVTGALVAWLKPDSVLDIAAGDGSIVYVANRLNAIGRAVLLDISAPNVAHITQNVLEYGWETIATDAATWLATSRETFDVALATEFLEHIEDPDVVLRSLRGRAKHLVASSPEMRDGQVDTNPEHLWMFDGFGYHQMLASAGWEPMNKTHLGFESEYSFQLWVAR